MNNEINTPCKQSENRHTDCDGELASYSIGLCACSCHKKEAAARADATKQILSKLDKMISYYTVSGEYSASGSIGHIQRSRYESLKSDLSQMIEMPIDEKKELTEKVLDRLVKEHPAKHDKEKTDNWQDYKRLNPYGDAEVLEQLAKLAVETTLKKLKHSFDSMYKDATSGELGGTIDQDGLARALGLVESELKKLNAGAD